METATHNITTRIDNITGLNGNNSVKPPCPRAVKIELTGKCDFRCSYCATGKRLRPQKEMDKSFYKRVVKELHESGVQELGMFYLGESFLCDWLPEAIKYAKDVGIPYVFLTTNGRMATKEKVKACMEAGLDSLKWSYNYADEDQFAEVTRVKKEWFKDIKKNMADAHAVRLKGGYDCGLFASSIHYSGQQLIDMKHAVDEILPYVDEHYWLPMYCQAGEVIEGNEDKELTVGNLGRMGNKRDPLPCWMLFSETRITWDGHLAACGFDHRGIFNMGDLNEVGFMEAWHSLKFQELRTHHLAKDVTDTICKDCIAWK